MRSLRVDIWESGSVIIYLDGLNPSDTDLLEVYYTDNVRYFIKREGDKLLCNTESYELTKAMLERVNYRKNTGINNKMLRIEFIENFISTPIESQQKYLDQLTAKARERFRTER